MLVKETNHVISNKHQCEKYAPCAPGDFVAAADGGDDDDEVVASLLPLPLPARCYAFDVDVDVAAVVVHVADSAAAAEFAPLRHVGGDHTADVEVADCTPANAEEKSEVLAVAAVAN